MTPDFVEPTEKPTHGRFKDLTGQRFGNLFVLDYWARVLSGRDHLWLCQCCCGNQTIVSRNHLRGSSVISCGCKSNAGRPLEHHGMHKTPVYRTWRTMISRCTPRHKSSRYYFERGIRVCEEWRNSFLAFYDHMGNKPDGMTLDRIDNDGNYEPGNCRWADWKTQNNNKRKKGTA